MPRPYVPTTRSANGDKRMLTIAIQVPRPWHRKHPLVKGQVYEVHSLTNGLGCIDIDGSGRAWQNWRFRPVRTTSIDVFTAMLAPTPRIKEPV